MPWRVPEGEPVPGKQAERGERGIAGLAPSANAVGYSAQIERSAPSSLATVSCHLTVALDPSATTDTERRIESRGPNTHLIPVSCAFRMQTNHAISIRRGFSPPIGAVVTPFRVRGGVPYTATVTEVSVRVTGRYSVSRSM